MRVFYDRDADANLIKSKNVAIIGYGGQGHAHALNLADSGVGDVAIAELEGSEAWEKAKKQKFKVMTTMEAAKWADFLMMLTPDELQADIYVREIRDHMKDGAALAFAHGLAIHYRLIEPDPKIDVVMVAPKAPGHTVRGEYMRGGGVPCLVGVEQDASGHAMEVALSYACALGAGRAGIIETTFRDETETDLFGEQAVLTGGLTELIKAGFDTLVEAGYPPEMAYFECLHEMKLNMDLIFAGGMADMLYAVSDTAEYGAYVCGPRVVDAGTRQRMREILEEIQSGQFVTEWINEYQAGRPRFKALRRRNADHPVEKVGEKLREMMPWVTETRLVDRSSN